MRACNKEGPQGVVCVASWCCSERISREGINGVGGGHVGGEAWEVCIYVWV